MIQAFYKGKRIVEIRKMGYLTDAFTKQRVVYVTFDDGERETVRIDAVELVQVEE
jgi:hypothetical protein